MWTQSLLLNSIDLQLENRTRSIFFLTFFSGNGGFIPILGGISNKLDISCWDFVWWFAVWMHWASSRVAKIDSRWSWPVSCWTLRTVLIVLRIIFFISWWCSWHAPLCGMNVFWAVYHFCRRSRSVLSIWTKKENCKNKQQTFKCWHAVIKCVCKEKVHS